MANTEQDSTIPADGPQAIDDDALDFVTGGKVQLCSTPSTCNVSSTPNYTVNSTIYFQVNITQNVT